MAFVPPNEKAQHTPGRAQKRPSMGTGLRHSRPRGYTYIASVVGECSRPVTIVL